MAQDISAAAPATGAGGATSPDTAAPVGTAPDKAGLVLASLILVAAVANLNLSVANVALPDIGAAFDASQTQLDLVAVGYSLGLAASVLWLGALGDRYGRKLMLVLGVLLSIPACLLAAFAPIDRGPDRRPDPRRRVGRHGLPDHARPDRRAVVRARHGRGRSPCGRRSAARSPRSDRSSPGSCSSASVGLGVPRHPAAGRGRPVHGARGTCRPTSTRRPSRSTTWAASCRRSCRRADPRHQLRAGPEQGNAGRSACSSSRSSPAIAFVIRQRRAAQPAVRPGHRRAPRVLGRRAAPASSSSAR